MLLSLIKAKNFLNFPNTWRNFRINSIYNFTATTNDFLLPHFPKINRYFLFTLKGCLKAFRNRFLLLIYLPPLNSTPPLMLYLFCNLNKDSSFFMSFCKSLKSILLLRRSVWNWYNLIYLIMLLNYFHGDVTSNQTHTGKFLSPSKLRNPLRVPQTIYREINFQYNGLRIRKWCFLLLVLFLFIKF